MTEDAEIDWYSNDIATFGDRVAAGREALGLSQKQLARKLGVAAKTVDSWEHDISEPRANKLQMLAGILNVSMPWLLTGEGDGVPHPLGSEQNQVALGFTLANPNDINSRVRVEVTAACVE